MDHFIEYLTKGTLPEDKSEAKRLRQKAALFMVQDGHLYRRGQSFPQLKSLTPKQGHQVLTSLHGSVYGNNAEAKNLAFKALQTGYYWPTMEADLKVVVRSCLQCHQYTNYINKPLVSISIIVSLVPFSQWGLNLIEELSTASVEFQYIIFTVDYYTNWIKAKTIAKITMDKVISFL
ncbi:uncharacterized protein LOC126784027 [Argentina anserina]|uniref:uncharacterized protein LOC126784027 n=1 Tax=Argentina anserina TaxID=57926 RepID=UPI0021765600|nr:uncharacterized protein LOC126784027 [Potentilla anserina]